MALVILATHIFMCMFFESERGPLLISYSAVSKGRLFRKYKFRVVRQCYVDGAAAAAGEWRAYAAEWDPKCRTYLGQFLKRYYLDELPQLLNIVSGEMSFVGPRPLAIHHYRRDLEQGNVHRTLLTAGLFGPSQALKGTTRYGNQDDEYKYLDAVMHSPALSLVSYDLKLIALGLLRAAEGKGL
ncbi:sugar transferase [Bradyrhizobium guangdongense]